MVICCDQKETVRRRVMYVLYIITKQCSFGSWLVSPVLYIVVSRMVLKSRKVPETMLLVNKFGLLFRSDITTVIVITDCNRVEIFLSAMYHHFLGTFE